MQRISIIQSFFLMLKGALIGIGAVMPGISGGVLCLVMGIYQPMMALIANPFREFKKRIGFFIPVIIGFALGILGISKGVELLFRSNMTMATWLFSGLIMGTLPGLYKEAGSKGRSKKDLLIAVIIFALVFSLLLMLAEPESAADAPSAAPAVTTSEQHTEPSTGDINQISESSEVHTKTALIPLDSIWTWALAGVLWAIGFMVPGMSPSAMFIFLGIYEPMSAGIAGFDFFILLPMGIAMLITLLLFSRFISNLFNKAYSKAMHFCFGTALASALAVLPIRSITSVKSALIYLIYFAIGAAIAFAMEKMSARIPSGEGQ